MAASRPWERLLHHKRGASEADGPGFFLSPRGKRDARAELDATLAAFFDPPDPPPGAEPRWQHPQCRFPARYAWLKRELGFDPARLSDRRCPRFEEWLQEVDADGASLVFADAFLNNPSSMYGHTFLRLHRRGGRPGEDLLDYTLNFAATPDDSNAALYALKGLFGAYPGVYSTMPYYMKIQEYNNVDSRDLWEYRLSLTPEQMAQLLRHAWEMGSTYFDYWFFSENCSYQLLTLLEGGAPELRLSDGFGFGVVPSDTVRSVVRQPGLVTSVRYRPSHVTVMKRRRAALSGPERAIATRLGRGEDPERESRLDALPPERQAAVLDAGYDYFRYRVGFDPDLAPDARRADRRLLLRRGRVATPSASLDDAPRPVRPDAAHATRRAGVSAGASSLGPFVDLHYRQTLHDLSDPDAGYVPDHQLEMGVLQLRIDGRRRDAYLERADVVRLVSLSPLDPWIRKPSWMASLGMDQAREAGCAGWACSYFVMRAGAGLSVATSWWRRETWYALAAGEASAGPGLERDWRAGGGPWGGARVELAPRWRVQVDASQLRYPWGPPRELLRVTQAVDLGPRLQLRVALERRTPAREASASLLAYF